jgi:hypothetical protein
VLQRGTQVRDLCHMTPEADHKKRWSAPRGTNEQAKACATQAGSFCITAPEEVEVAAEVGLLDVVEEEAGVAALASERLGLE